MSTTQLDKDGATKLPASTAGEGARPARTGTANATGRGPAWTKWSFLGLLLLDQAYGVFSASLGSGQPEGARRLIMAALFTAAGLWLYGDRPSHADAADQYHGFGAIILWPALMPFYLVQTRGWKGVLRIASLLLLALILGWAVGTLAASLAT